MYACLALGNHKQTMLFAYASTSTVAVIIMKICFTWKCAINCRQIIQRERERANRWGEGTRSGTGEIKCRIISAINHLRVFARKMPCTRAYDFFLLFRFSNISDEDCSSRKSRKKCVHAVLFTIEMAAKLSASYQMKRRTQRNYTCSLLDIVDTVWHRLWFTTPPPFNSVTHRRNPKHFVRVCTVDACG